MNTSHLNAIISRLSNERYRLSQATNSKEIEMRKVWVAGIEQELESEYKFLGIKPQTMADVFAEISDDELLLEMMK